MPAKNPWQHEVVQMNNKGLDLIHPIEQVDAEHYSRMEDIKSTQEGTLGPRPGTALINAIAFDAQQAGGAVSSEAAIGVGDSPVVVTSAAQADTVGSWVELIASTDGASFFMLLTITGLSGVANRHTEFDVAIGAAASEVAFITNMYTKWRNDSNDYGHASVFPFPIAIASGQRVSVRIKDESSSALVCHVSLNLYK